MEADLLRRQIQQAEEALDLVRRVDDRKHHPQLIADLEALLAEKRQALSDLDAAEKAEDHSDRAARRGVEPPRTESRTRLSRQQR
jgi:hypothetical protein